MKSRLLRVIVAALVAAAVLSSCGKKKKEESSDVATTVETSTESNTEAAVAATTEQIVQIEVTKVVGETLDQAESELRAAGFTNIKSNADAGADKSKWVVKSQMPLFGTMAEPSDKITLDCIEKLTVPDVQNKNIDDALSTLKDAGFKNVTDNTESDPDWDRERWIVTDQSAAARSEVLADESLSLTCTKLCHLYIDVTSEDNWFFSKYDMEVYVDDDNLGAVANGTEFTKLTDVLEGRHSFTVYKGGDHSVSGSSDLDVSDDMTFKCDISHDSDSIEFKNMQTADGVGESALVVPDVTKTILSTAVNKLSSEGFSNVRYEPYSDIWDTGNWIVISQDTAPGTQVDKTTKIVLQCKKTDQYMSENFANKDAVAATKAAEELGFSTGYIDNPRNLYIGKKYLALPEEEQQKWMVTSAAFRTDDSTKVEFRMFYTGSVTMPDVRKQTLANAIKALHEAEFSHVEYVSDDGSSIWDTNNWDVIKQSVDPGKTTKASGKVTLTVKHHETAQTTSSSSSSGSSKKEESAKQDSKPAESKPAADSGSTKKDESGKKSEEKDTGKKQEIKVNYEKHFAFRSAVAAVENYMAEDVFDDTGNYPMPEKFHKYSDLSGNLDKYLMIVTKQGTWTPKSEDTWHVEHLCMYRYGYGSEFDLALDVTKKDGYYWVHNIEDPIGEGVRDLVEASNDNEDYFKVSPDLVKDGRSDKKLKEITNGTSSSSGSSSGSSSSSSSSSKTELGLDQIDAEKAFEHYWERNYPYKVKFHWYTGGYGEKSADGTWWLQVNADVQNEYGTYIDMVLYGTVDPLGNVSDVMYDYR